MNSQQLESQTSDVSARRDNWFDEFIAQLRVEQVKLDANISSKETEAFFNALVNDDVTVAVQQASAGLHKKMTFFIITDFLVELLNKRKTKVSNLAFDLSGQEVLIWAVVKDDDEKAERDIFLAESAVNAKYDEMNYNISVTVIEESDNIDIPSQYLLLPRARA